MNSNLASTEELALQDSLVVPDQRFHERLRKLADALEQGAQMTVENQQHVAFRLSQDHRLSQQAKRKLSDTEAAILEIERVQQALMQVQKTQQDMLHKSFSVTRLERHLSKEIHFTTMGGGSAKLLLHTARRGEEITVHITNNRKKLGISFSLNGRLCIVDILEGGPIQKFNEANPDMQVCIGDTILQADGVTMENADQFEHLRSKSKSMCIKLRRKPSYFRTLNGVSLDKIIESELLWIAPEGTDYDPNNIEICERVSIKMDAADAVHPTKLGFANGGFLNSPRYTLCDGTSLSLCKFLDKTWQLCVSQGNPHENRKQHVSDFVQVWYEKHLGVERSAIKPQVKSAPCDYRERSRSPSARSGKSQRSAISNGSIGAMSSISVDVEDKCFLGETLLMAQSGAHVRAIELEEGALVMGASGKLLQVMRVRQSRSPDSDLVWLCTKEACLKVTASHRVVVFRGGIEQKAPAKSLRVGDDVLCSKGEKQSLLEVVATREDAEVVQVVFHPDEPVEAFMIPNVKILSCGHKRRTNRRSGMRRASCPKDFDIPDTDDPLNL